MANTMTLSNAARSAALDAVTALLNVGGAGSIEIYSGTQPAGPDTAVTDQTLLVTLTFSSTAFGPASNGVAMANPITSGTAVATGTATWARLKSGAGTAVMDCDVGVTGDPSVVIGLASTTISTGIEVGLESFELTHPA